MGEKKKMSDVLRKMDSNKGGKDKTKKGSLLKTINEGSLLRTTQYTREKKED